MGIMKWPGKLLRTAALVCVLLLLAALLGPAGMRVGAALRGEASAPTLPPANAPATFSRSLIVTENTASRASGESAPPPSSPAPVDGGVALAEWASYGGGADGGLAGIPWQVAWRIDDVARQGDALALSARIAHYAYDGASGRIRFEEPTLPAVALTADRTTVALLCADAGDGPAWAEQTLDGIGDLPALRERLAGRWFFIEWEDGAVRGIVEIYEG